MVYVVHYFAWRKTGAHAGLAGNAAFQTDFPGLAGQGLKKIDVPGHEWRT
jgi:hypothetical protein